MNIIAMISSYSYIQSGGVYVCVCVCVWSWGWGGGGGYLLPLLSMIHNSPLNSWYSCVINVILKRHHLATKKTLWCLYLKLDNTWHDIMFSTLMIRTISRYVQNMYFHVKFWVVVISRCPNLNAVEIKHGWEITSDTKVEKWMWLLIPVLI